MQAALKITLIMLWLLACVAVERAIRLFSPIEKRRARTLSLMQLYFRGALRILGVRLQVSGAPDARRPLLIVSNHTSYLDIMVIGASAPVRFTPKADIAGWPLIGWICRVLDCVFIDRRPGRTAENAAALSQALSEGALLWLFPEGTTNDGKRLLPFRSSYFSLTGKEYGGQKLAVQTAAVKYTHVRGLPLDVAMLPKVAWYGDMELAPHFKELMGLGRIDAVLTFGEASVPEEGADRKALAAACEREVAEMLWNQ